MPENYLPLRYEGVDANALQDYGRKLVAAGFRVWFTPADGCGYLTYEKEGNYGTLQCSYFEGWGHSMPIVPSREFGSSMYVGSADRQSQKYVFTVQAAEECARPTNYNPDVGTQRNEGAVKGSHWLSPDAVEITLTD